MPSDKAMQLAKTINDSLTWSDCVGNSGIGEHQAATLIDTALAKARLEGAKAMLNVVRGCYNSGGGGPWNLDEEFMAYLRNLDPQQVINESVK